MFLHLRFVLCRNYIVTERRDMFSFFLIYTIIRAQPDFASQEKVTALTFDLPSAQTEIPARINAGDIYLWSGNNLVLFYTTFSNSYSYVPVGRITDASSLADTLGSGSLRVTFSIND